MKPNFNPSYDCEYSKDGSVTYSYINQLGELDTFMFVRVPPSVARQVFKFPNFL